MKGGENMKAFKRSTEVVAAVARFETLTGHQVIKAKRYNGSMKGYVQFIIKGDCYELVKKVVDDADLDYWHEQLGNCTIQYKRNLDYAGGKYIGTMAVDVRWEALGMSYNNAYQPSLRKLNGMMI